jgi:hypothetical protein
LDGTRTCGQSSAVRSQAEGRQKGLTLLQLSLAPPSMSPRFDVVAGTAIGGVQSNPS